MKTFHNNSWIIHEKRIIISIYWIVCFLAGQRPYFKALTCKLYSRIVYLFVCDDVSGLAAPIIYMFTYGLCLSFHDNVLYIYKYIYVHVGIAGKAACAGTRSIVFFCMFLIELLIKKCVDICNWSIYSVFNVCFSNFYQFRVYEYYIILSFVAFCLYFHNIFCNKP